MTFTKNKTKILITGAGGFIGGHLVKYFKNKKRYLIRAVDIKPLNEWLQLDSNVENLSLDLTNKNNCYRAMHEVDEIYNLASNMGGIGFIESNKANCMLSVLINTHLLMAARDKNVNRYFFSSSACVYTANKQTDLSNPGLKESDAYPAMPEDGYGWEKLFSERMCHHFREDFGLNTRVARFHNVYGPHGTYEGGREKAPAALVRKVINSKISKKHEIEIWGDGKQTRSFMYIDDCIKGIDLIMHSKIEESINLGSSEIVSINQLVGIIEKIAKIKLKKNYNLDAPKGVRGRSSDNTLIQQYLEWEPSTSLKTGMKKLYEWIYQEIINK
jgi:nucleoside-diphosphate-sugar epimerase